MQRSKRSSHCQLFTKASIRLQHFWVVAISKPYRKAKTIRAWKEPLSPGVSTLSSSVTNRNVMGTLHCWLQYEYIQGGQKNVVPFFVRLNFNQISTDFQNYFTVRIRRKCVIVYCHWRSHHTSSVWQHYLVKCQVS